MGGEGAHKKTPVFAFDALGGRKGRLNNTGERDWTCEKQKSK